MRGEPFVLCLCLTLVHCGSSAASSGGGPVAALYVVPASLGDLADVHVYDHPWPSDLRLDPDGSIHLDGFYNPRQIPIIQAYLDAMRGQIHGFSPVAAAYLRFTGDLDPTSLPSSPPATLDPAATVQIVDVDASSPEVGQRKLAQVFWRQATGVYWLSDTLAVAPALGFPLRPKTRYAIVVTTGARAADGTPVQPSEDLEEVLGVAPATARTQAAHDLFAPAVAALGQAGLAPPAIAHLTVFTTNDPTEELFAVADDVHASVPAPTVEASSWQQMEQTSDYDVYQGVYGPAPNYQAGQVPYQDPSDGGGFVFDATGKPVLQNTFTMRFTFVVPGAAACPMPATGYPMALYAHGTGGDYRSIVDETNSVGQALAQKCVASMGVDQIFHGIRPGAPPLDDPNRETDIELLYFNFNNPAAARSNGRQSGVDVVQQARLFTDSHVSIPASVSRTGSAILFDATRLVSFGHSQGSLNDPLYLAADDTARGGVLSGASAMITVALLEKTEPQPSVAAAVRLLLGLADPDDAPELNAFHPALNLAQTIVDPVDPIHYAVDIVRHPRVRAGVTLAPKSVYQTEGIGPDGVGDHYAPPDGIEYLSLALGLPRELPGVRAIAGDAWANLADVTVPADGLSGNLAAGLASGVLGQFPPAPNDDGHFVVFDVPAARAQAAGFCANLAALPEGKVPALGP